MSGAVAFAAADAVLEVISIVPDAIAVVKWLADKIAPPLEASQDTVVRVWIGSQVGSDDANNLGGDVPGVSLWDPNGALIGSKAGRSKKLRQGTHEDITITARENPGNVAAHYLGISAGGIDALCIAGVTVTFTDGSKTAFSGNIPKSCGAAWANSETQIQTALGDGKSPTPDCVWIDGNGSNGLPYQGFGVHLPSFGTGNKKLAESYKVDSRLMCKSGPRFRMYDKLTSDNPVLVFPTPPRFFLDGDPGTTADNVGLDKDPGFIIENPGVDGKRLERKKKRFGDAVMLTSEDQENDLTKLSHSHGFSGVVRSYPPPRIGARSSDKNTDFVNGTDSSSIQPPKIPVHHKVIVSPHDYNSAKRLCESETSWGHSFVSLSEGLFCDMEDKTLYYNCDNSEAPSSSSCCYDTTQDNLLACTSGVSKRDGTMEFHMPISSLMMDIDNGAATQGMVNGKIFTDINHWQAR